MSAFLLHSSDSFRSTLSSSKFPSVFSILCVDIWNSASTTTSVPKACPNGDASFRSYFVYSEDQGEFVYSPLRNTACLGTMYHRWYNYVMKVSHLWASFPRGFLWLKLRCFLSMPRLILAVLPNIWTFFGKASISVFTFWVVWITVLSGGGYPWIRISFAWLTNGVT